MGDDQINALTEAIIGAAFRVSNELGAGFIEKVYENSLALELRKLSLEVEQQHPVVVYYDQTVVGEYYADLLVANTVVVEVKAVSNHDDAHAVQCLNYLKATRKPICLWLNFGKPKVEIKRFRR